jgi:CheY-like chemotaxis protein
MTPTKHHAESHGEADKLEPCHKKRILIADDDGEIREMLQLVLSCDLPDCRVDVAVNGAEAVEAFRDAHHGILIVDVRMPIMGGEDAYKEIKSICKGENLQIPSFIFCTGYDPPQSLVRTAAIDSRHCMLRKPIDPDTLVEVLRTRIE